MHLPVPLLERLRPRLSAGFRLLAWGPDADPALVDEETRISDRNPLHVFKAQTLHRLQLTPQALAGWPRWACRLRCWPATATA